MTPTEAHWQEAERQYRSFTGLTFFERGEGSSQALAQLVADGAVAPDMRYKPTRDELLAACDYASAYLTDGRKYTFEAWEWDRRGWLVAGMLRSLKPSTTPLTDGERAALQAEIAELRAFKDGVQKLGGW